MEETLRMKMERQQSKERSGDNALDILTPGSTAVANIRIIDERFAQRFARQHQKERTGASALSAAEVPRTPREVAEQAHDEVAESMPDTTAELEFPHLLGRGALDNLLVVSEKVSFKDSAPVGFVAQRRGAFQRSTANSPRPISTKKFLVEAPCDGLVSQRVNNINRGLSFQTPSHFKGHL
jgi:hypothetical protein